jgi:proline racemase
MALQVGGRAVRVDVAFGGEFYAIVDSESVGVPVDTAHAAQLLRVGTEISNAMKMSEQIRGAIFTGPPRGSSDLRSATVLYGGQDRPATGGVLKRSPGVAGTCALMAVLHAMGLLPDDHTFTHEGVIETKLTGRVVSRPSTDGEPASVTPTVEGTAFITGRHEFQIDDDDPIAPFAI